MLSGCPHSLGPPRPCPGVWGAAAARCPVVVTPVSWLSPGPASVVTLGVCRVCLLARCPVLGAALRSGR